MLNLKSLLNKIVSTGIFKSGTTMTGELKLSYNDFVACGHYDSSQTSYSEFASEVKMSSGAMGTVQLGSFSPIVGTHYDYIYMPHRSGGTNGASNGDNTSYGSLLLFYNIWTPSEPGNYVANIKNGTAAEIGVQSGFYGDITFTSTSNSYYSLTPASCYGSRYSDGTYGKLITLYITCNGTPQTSWQEIGKYTVSTYPSNDFNFSFVGTNSSVIQGYIAASTGKIYVRGGQNGGTYTGTIGLRE